jgi:hypothetical protein
MGYILADGNPSVYNFDLGLGSRLFAWAQAYYCAQAYNYTVVIPDDEWVEQLFLNLPNTIVMSREDINNIEWNILKFYGKHIQSKKYWKIYGMCTINEDYVKKRKDPLWKITFKSDKINNFFENKFDNFVGFHLRRWHGVPVEGEHVNDTLKSLPNGKIRLEYYKMWKEHNSIKIPRDTDPPWIFDKVYYSVLDKIKSPIYLSTDLPKELYSYYKDRYSNIVDMYDYIEEWEELLSEKYDLDKITTLANATVRTVSHDLLDMFALSKCSSFILSADSQWGMSSVRLNNRKNHIRKFYVVGMLNYAKI